MNRVVPALGCLVLAVAFAGLGAWQMERRTWKLDLIERVAARTTAPAVPMPPPADWTPADWAGIEARRHEYRRVQARGTLLNDRETLVQAVTEHGPGWWVMTPLLTDGGTVLVNRGFVPREYRDPGTRGGLSPTGPVTVTGLLRMSEPHGGFLRSNDAAAGRWFSRDVAAIAAARRLDRVAPFFIDADATPNPGRYPVGGLTVIAFRNTHLAYALTWFALAALSLFGGLLFARSGRDRRSDRGPGRPCP